MNAESYTDKGEVELAQCDDANIPVNMFLCEPDEESPKWRWTADLFMPRKLMCMEGAFSIEADSKESIVAAVQKHVVPLYEAALTNLKTRGENYYWEVKNETPANPIVPVD